MPAKRQSKVYDESDSEDDEFKDLAIWRKPRSSRDNSISLQFEIPASVQAVIDKIEESQSIRAKEDLLANLAGIMNNVQLIMTRYNIDSLSPGIKGTVSEGQKKKRKAFLEKIAICVKNTDIRERTLSKILSWLEEWNFILSEVAAINMDEYHHWIAKMELMPDMLKGINNNVESLIQMTMFLIEEKKRLKKKTYSTRSTKRQALQRLPLSRAACSAMTHSTVLFEVARGTLWKAWKDRAIKRPATAQALRPDQMICDQIGLNAKVSEIQSMLQELISTAMFSKLENNAIKYMSATLLNLSKALSTVNEELRLVSFRVAKSFMKEDQGLDKEKDHSQQVIQELSEENEVLQQKLREAEEKCDQLIRIKNYLGRQMMHPTASLRTVVMLPLQVPYVSREARDTESEEKVDDSQKKGAKSSAVVWDASASEVDPDAAKQQPEDKVETAQDQKKLIGLPLTAETSDTNLETEEKKSSQLAVLKAFGKKKPGKPKAQEGKGASSMWEQLKKGKSEQLFRGSPGSPESRESALKLTEKEAKSEADLVQPEGAPEVQKPETKWKKLIAAKTEEVLGSPKQSSKVLPKAPKGTPEESEQGSLESFQRAILAYLREKTNNVGKVFDPKSIKKEESSLGKAEVEKLNVIKAKMEEYFQKVAETVTTALRTYRDERKVQPKEKPKKQPKGAPRTLPKQGTVGPKSGVGKVLLSEITDPAIKKLVQMLLEEIDSDLKYKKTTERQQEEAQAQKEELRPKVRDKVELLEVWRQAFKVPETHPVQDTREEEEVEKPKWSEPAQQDLWRAISQSSINLAPRGPKTTKPQISQVQGLQVEPAVMGATEEKQPKLSPPSSKTPLVSARPPPIRVPGQAQIIGPQMSPQLSMTSLTPGQAQIIGPQMSPQLSMTSLTPGQAQSLSGPLTRGQEQELGTRLIVPKILEPTQTPKGSLTSEKPQAVQISKVTTEEISGVTDTQGTILPIQQVQIKDRIRTSQQALEQETTPTPEQYKGPRITLTPQQTQALGVTLTPEQTKSPRISLTHEQAQALGVTLTPDQYKEQRISLTPQQAQVLGITLNLQQAKALGITLTPEQVKAQRVSLIPRQAQAQGTTLTTQQAEAQRINLTPEQAKALGLSLTPPQPVTLAPEQAQALGVTPTPQPVILSPEQAQALGVTPTPQQVTLSPEQAQALGITPTPQPVTLSPKQAQALGVTPTPQPVTLSPKQAQALALTLTAEQQVKTQRVNLSPQQTQALGITPTPQPITFTPEQTQALGITLTPRPVTITPEQAQALAHTLTAEQVSLSPQQAQTLGITLSPQRTSLSPEQTQALGITPTPQPITLTPEQVQALGIASTPQSITLAPEQAQELGIIPSPQQTTLSPEQTQALGIAPTPQPITLTPEQIQALGITPTQQPITLTPEQAQALGITLTPQPVPLAPEQTETLGITPTPQPTMLTPEQIQVLGLSLIPKQQEISLSPQQAQALGLTLTPEQAQVQKIYLTPQQAQALGVTLSPEQAKALKFTLTPEQAHSLGIAITVEQARAQRINLTPQQAQDLGLTLTPEQAQDLGLSLIPKQREISLSPQQAQVLGLTLTPQQAQVQKIYLTPQQAQALGVTLSPEQAKALKISLTPEQAHSLGIILTVEQARAQRISLTPQQAEALGITLTPEQAQVLGISLIPKEQEISFSPQQAQALGITLTPQQAQVQKIYLTPQQAQALDITLSPEQAKTPAITLTPEQAHSLGITLTVEQANAQKINLTPQQAQDLGITLTPGQAQDLGVSLLPKKQEISFNLLQAQALGLTLTPQQAQVQKIYLTPQQAQALGVTLSPEQAKALKITLTPEQAHSLGITLTVEQARAQKINLTPQQAEDLGLTLTPEQAQDLGVSLIPKEQEISFNLLQAQALGLTLTPQQAQVQKIYLTPQQAQALGVTLRPEQAQGISLTPEQAHSLGITLTVEQARAQKISLTPQQAEDLGITLTPEQAQDLGIPATPKQTEALEIIPSPTPEPDKERSLSLTPEQVQALRISFPPKETQPLGIYLTPKQARKLGITLTANQAKVMKISLTPEQAQALGITFTPEQAKVQRTSLTPKQAQALGLTLTPEQAQAHRITLTHEQAQALGLTLTPEQAQAQGILSPKKFQKLDVPLTYKQAEELRSSLSMKQLEAQRSQRLISESIQTPKPAVASKQTQTIEIPLTTQLPQAVGAPPSKRQETELGISPLTLKLPQAVGAPPSKRQETELGISPLTLKLPQAVGAPPSKRQETELGIFPTPKSSQAVGTPPSKRQETELGIFPTPKSSQAVGTPPSKRQETELGIFPTPKSSQAVGTPPSKRQETELGISPLTLKPSQVIGTPPSKRQETELGISPLTPKPSQVIGTPPSKRQETELGISPLTPKPSQVIGTPPSKRQETELGISPLTPKPSQVIGTPPSKRQETELGISPLTPKQTQAVGALLSKRQVMKLGTFPLTPKQTQAVKPVEAKPLLTSRQALPLQGRFAPELTQTLLFAITLEKAQNLGITFTYEQTRAAAVTLTSEQVAALEDALTEELAWRWERLDTLEKAQEAADIVPTKQAQALGIAAHQPAQGLHAPFTLEKPATLVPSTERLSQRSKDFHPASIPLQALKPPPTQAPFPPMTSLGMSILPDSEKPWMSPTYRQTLADRGQGIPAQPLAPEIPPSLRQLLAPGAPPTPGPPLGPRHFFKPRDTWPPLISDPLLPPRTPTSRVPPTSGEVSALVSGGSATHGELLVSRTSHFQPPAVHEQAPLSTPEQQGPSWVVHEQDFIPTISPTPLHPSTAEALPSPGRTQRISPSSAKPLKPKSARALPGTALGLGAPQAPFPIEKTQRPMISGTTGQTQVLQDSFGMQPFGIFQPRVASSRIPRSQSPLMGEKALSREKPGIPLPSLTTQLPQTPQISISEKGQKPWFPPIDKPWTPTPVSGTREAKTMVSPFTDQYPEDRYVVDVEAQRKNLATLNQAAQTSGLPAQYLTIAKNLITELLHIDTIRLGYLSRKYVAYRLIQLARNHLTKRVKTIQNTGKGYETQKLYIMLDRIDQYQKKAMQGWTDRQKQLDQRRKQCLRSMTHIFSQLEKAFKLTLSQPMPSVPSFKKIPEFTKLQRPVLEILIDDSKRSDLFKTLGQAPLEAVWNADLSTASYPIMEKAPMSALWAQLGGYPDIPKLLQLDIQSTFRKSLASIRSQPGKMAQPIKALATKTKFHPQISRGEKRGPAPQNRPSSSLMSKKIRK